MRYLTNVAESFGIEIAKAPMNIDGTYAAAKLTKDSAINLYMYYKNHIKDLERPRKFHITTTFSRKVIELKPKSVNIKLNKTKFKYELLGDNREVLVLRVENPILDKLFDEGMKAGATWDYPDYKAHITLCTKFNGTLEELPPTPNFNLYCDKYYVEPLDLSY